MSRWVSKLIWRICLNHVLCTVYTFPDTSNDSQVLSRQVMRLNSLRWFFYQILWKLWLTLPAARWKPELYPGCVGSAALYNQIVQQICSHAKAKAAASLNPNTNVAISPHPSSHRRQSSFSKIHWSIPFWNVSFLCSCTLFWAEWLDGPFWN